MLEHEPLARADQTTERDIASEDGNIKPRGERSFLLRVKTVLPVILQETLRGLSGCPLGGKIPDQIFSFTLHSAMP